MLDSRLVLHLEAGDVARAGVPVPEPVALRVQQVLPCEEAGLLQLLRKQPVHLLVERRQFGIIANRGLGERGLAQSKLG